MNEFKKKQNIKQKKIKKESSLNKFLKKNLDHTITTKQLIGYRDLRLFKEKYCFQTNDIIQSKQPDHSKFYIVKNNETPQLNIMN